ncbi:2Fe-2S iron-sulfur cluster binding domain protein [Candidatus Desulfosporosinus infrequens]|uniref:2Fe-2S iron-sulfur cluster binding domain protein n=1 Tax=Candidatus Desulfosporosinus infrequens TaxID=2043169 RepID=A0A2U3LQ98_9FIRM|nr:2Fe-2S iron-sulfur cluster binding domain protein [Candidatus Desulfosporosinus infrequens]
MFKITFLPSKKVVQTAAEITILQAAILAGVPIESTCGGKGICGKCQVQVREDCPTASEQELSWVLACQYFLTQDTLVKLQDPLDAFDRKISFVGLVPTSLVPSIQKYPVTLTEPSVADQTSDWERLLVALPKLGITFSRSVATSLPKTLRQGKFQVTAVLDGNRLLAVEPSDTAGRCYGLAVDIGTTTVVAYLMNLITGTLVTSGAVTNPQQGFGADVISRITHAAKGPENLLQLQETVMGGLNGIITQLCQASGVSPDEIYQTVVVGNTTMTHLFLGIDPTFLAPAPFIPVFQRTVEVEARELGLKVLGTGTVVVLPSVAGYVGADTVGVMLAAGADRLSGVSLIVDIGTNGEIILTGKGRILTCSTAAGPAFEGAEIKYGMRAAEGAVEGVSIDQDVELTVIGGGKVRGICGSGLIDAIAQMLKVGVISSSGRYENRPLQLEELPPLVRGRLRNTERASEFVLVWGEDSVSGEDIVLSQKDIREMQLAKGAILAGIMVLLQEMGSSPQEIERILLAGAFGNYIKRESALGIGLLPSLPLDRITTIGNAAGDGAKMSLLSTEERARAELLAQRAEHIELSTKKDFQVEFIKALAFGVVV